MTNEGREIGNKKIVRAGEPNGSLYLPSKSITLKNLGGLIAEQMFNHCALN